MGQFHTKYKQQYNGIPVWKSELVTHSNQLGEVVSMTGKYIPSPSNISTTPSVSADSAIATAIAKVAPDTANDEMKSDSKLVIYSDEKRFQPVLAWEVTLNISYVTYTVLVDANSAKVILSYNNIHTENVVGSGTDLLGQIRQINVWKDSGKFYANDASKSMFDNSSMNPMDFDEKKGVINIYDAQNKPVNNKLSNDVQYYRLESDSSTSGWLADAVSASYNLSKTFDYYKDKHDRNSLDGEGGRITAVIQFGKDYKNAFWVTGPNMMFFGKGDNYTASIDIVGHELSHGVTSVESNLLYQYQSGAMNESLSDIFGEAIERFSQGSNDWIIGAELTEPFRSMKDPGSFLIQAGMPYPSKMSEYINTTQDNGGIHLNSSIINHAFYLLAEGGNYAIGMDKAEQIFYRANTTYLLVRSQFSDLRIACIQSADDIHGANSTQSKAVASAFDAVEIYDAPTKPPTKPGTPANAADSLIMVTQQNGKLHIARKEKTLDNGSSVYFSNTQASGHRPAVSGDGSTAVFITSEHNICFMSTESGLSSDRCLKKELDGSFFSVAFSPDSRFISIILKDPNEHQGLPTVNIIDLHDDNPETNTKSYKLKAAKVDDSDSNKITSADAMDFTANNRYLVYDALNEFTLNNKTVQVWSIYALDLQKGDTIALLAPNVNQQAGFPSLSNINNNLMTFDIFDIEKDENNVAVADLSTGKVTVVAKTSTFSVPSLTGDDKSIVYSKKNDSTSIGYSLNIVSSGGGDSKEWVKNAYAGIVYRRGTLTAPSSIDLQVSQTVKLTPNTNDSLTFNILVKNSGPDTASNIVLNNNFSSGLEIKSNPPSGCTKKTNTKVECKVSKLKSGATKTFSLVLRATKTGELSNSAHVNATEEDSNTNNDTHVLKFNVTKTGGSGGGSSGGSTSIGFLLILTLLLGFLKIAKKPIRRRIRL